MARYEITAPDGNRYEITAPDDATEDQVLAYAASNANGATSQPFKGEPQPKTASQKMADIDAQGKYTWNLAGLDTGIEMSPGVSHFFAGAGKGMTDMARGAGQLVGLADRGDEAQARQMDAPLMSTGAGRAGSMTGQIATAIPATLVPGANTLPGAAVMGGLMGAAQPVTGDESRPVNVGAGMAGGMAGYGLARGASKMLTGAAKQINPVKQATMQSANEAGYVMPPSQMEAGVVPRLVEGLSGKYKTNQLAGIRNQQITDALAKKSIGLSPDDILSPEVLRGIRETAYKTGYDPISSLGNIRTDKAFNRALNGIAGKYQGAAKSFPGAVSDDVSGLVNGLRVKGFDADSGLKMTQILRDTASKAYSSGDKAMGKAAREAAGAIEDQIERRLSVMGEKGSKALGDFRAARKLMAKTHTVEKALVEGSGNIDAKVIAREFGKGKPLSGEQETIGKFAQVFPDVAGVPKSGNANPFTAVDFGVGGIGYSLNPYLAAMPAARVAGRYGILSKAAQSAMAKPAHAKVVGPAINSLLSPLLQRTAPQLGAYGLLGVTK